MSVKDVEKLKKSKKASDVYSLRHEKKSPQSISSLSSHVDQFRNQRNRLRINLEDTQSSIEYYRNMINLFIGRNDEYSKQREQTTQQELRLWIQTKGKICKKLIEIESQIRKIDGSIEKPRKKKNYGLIKRKEPPSDNE